MTWYQVTFNDGVLWAETSDLGEALDAFEEVKDFFPQPERIVFSEWYVPPSPTGHWLDVAVVSNGKTIHDHRLTRYTE